MLWYHELPKSPDLEDLNSWAQIRVRGRLRYVGRFILLSSLVMAGTWLLAVVIAIWAFRKEFSTVSYLGLVLGPPLGWLVGRDRWVKNEQRYMAATSSRHP